MKNQATIKLATKFNNDFSKFTLLGNWFDQRSQDPLGLPRTVGLNTISGNTDSYNPSVFTNRKSVPVSALDTDSRVIRNNAQIGFNIEHVINQNNQLNFMTYVGHRFNSQFLPTLTNQNTTATSPDGKDSLYQRSFWGSDLRLTNTGALFDRKYSVTAGLNYGSLSDARIEKDAYNGSIVSPVNLKRDEINIAYNFDQYFQAQFNPVDKLDFHAGVRRSTVNFRIADNLVDLSQCPCTSAAKAKYADSTGDLSFQKTTPVIGVVWKQSPTLNFYANYGKGFETPTFIEIANTNDTYGGSPNWGLKPSKSENYEFGIKAFVGTNTRINAAIYKVNSYQEIVALSSGTYSVYTNAGKTNREGFELSIDSTLPYNFNFYGSFSYLDATFQSRFADYTLGQFVEKDNKIAGTYRDQVYGEISWKYPEFGFKTALEAKHNSNVYVDNRNTDQAPDYTIYNLRAGFEQAVSKWKIKEFVRVENITDKDYIGSVRVNDSKSYFFESGAGRNYLLGINASYQF
jgi:iron complex outermembrane receptor protein